MEVAARSRVGPYEIVAPLGAGGMGEVYRARDPRLDREVAIKVLPSAFASDPGRLRRFEKEARATAALSHPNILAIFDVGSAPLPSRAAGERHPGAAGGDEGDPPEKTVHFLVTELLEGETLRARVAHGGLTVTKSVELAVQIARGLAAAHEKGIVHRDLKPDNVFVTKNGTVKILDFGLAKLTEPDRDAPASSQAEPSTATAAGLGTVAYMSPEQLRGQAVTAASDIFAFGCVLYEMLSGQRAFAAPTPADTVSAILCSDPPPLSAVRREQTVPVPLQHIVTRCLEKKPEDRFESAHDLALALPAALDARDASATAETTAGPRRLVRRPFAVAAIAVGALLGIVALWQWQESASAPAPASVPKRVAVLPFENLGDPGDSYFSEGMADEVRGKLASLSGMTVIARASCEPYKGTMKPPAQIAAELGAPYLLTARVRWEKRGGTSRIRVTAELVEAASSAVPATRWQDSFDADLENVFRVQSEIAARVARALELVLDARDRERLAERPTANLAGWEAFVRGQRILVSVPSDLLGGLRAAIADLERAVALDPSFALAWAQLSRARVLAWANGLPSRSLAEGAHDAAVRAVQLAPTLAEARMALGYGRLWIDHDTAGALAELERGLAEHPRNADLLSVTAVAKEVQGRWDEGLADLEHAVSFDPRSVYALWHIGRNHLWHRRYAEARAALDRALAVNPASSEVIWDRTKVFVAQGDVAGARAFVAEISGKEEHSRIAVLMADADSSMANPLSWLLVEEQREALLRLDPSAFGEDSAKWDLILAGEYAIRGDEAKARRHAERAATAYASRLAESPDNARLHTGHGLALAGLGRRDEALRAGKRAVELLPISRDAYFGPCIQNHFVRICILVGEHQKALDLLEPLLRIPYVLSPAWLAVDPVFAPLRGNPRFERLLIPRAVNATAATVSRRR